MHLEFHILVFLILDGPFLFNPISKIDRKPKDIISIIFKSGFVREIFNDFVNVVLGASVGSLIACNPIVSYVLGGEFLKYGVELSVVLAFLLAWVTVGLVQLPAESILLGKKFALIRNLMSFISAILISFLVVLALQII